MEAKSTLILDSKLLKWHSKAKHRAPVYSRALCGVRGVFQRIVRRKPKLGYQRVRRAK